MCDKQTTSALQSKIDESPTSSNLLDLKTLSDISSGTFSLLHPQLSSSLYSTSFFDDIFICESKISSKNSSTSSSEPVTHSLKLRSRPIQTSSSSSTISTSSSILHYCVNTHNLIHLLLNIFHPLFRIS